LNLDALKSTYLKAAVNHGAKANIAAIAAGLIAPQLLKNDDRGYGRTALLTTPLAAAGYVTGPAAFAGFRSAKTQMQTFIDNSSFQISDWKRPRMTLPEIRDLEQSGALNPLELHALYKQHSAIRQRATIDFYSQKAIRTNRPIEEIRSSVLDLFERQKRTLVNPTPQIATDFTNALFESRLKASTAGDRLRSPELTQFPETALSLDEVAESIATGFSADATEEQQRTFYQNMKRRLVQAGDLDVGRQVRPEVGSFSAYQTSVDFTSGSEASGILTAGGRQDLAGAMTKAVEEGWVNQAKLLLNEQGSPVGIHVTRGSEKLTFGTVNAGGATRVGENLEHSAVARGVIWPEGIHPLDFSLARALDPKYGSLKRISQDLTTHALHAGNSVDDTWLEQISDHTSRGELMGPEAKFFRSKQVGFSSLPLYGPNGDRAYQDLTYSEQVAEINKREGTITKLSGEAGKGVFELKELEQSIPGQMTALDSTNSTWRSVSKNKQLDTSGVKEVPTFQTSYVADQYGGRAPTVHADMATVTPQQVDLFGSLPSEVEELANPLVEREAMAAIRRDLEGSKFAEAKGLTGADLDEMVRTTWSNLRGIFEKQPERLKAIRKLGGLGESDFLISDYYGRYNLKSYGTAQVKTINEDLLKNPQFRSNQALGYTETGAPVHSDSTTNVLTQYDLDRGTGLYNLNYEKYDPVETGSKFEGHGNKALVIKAERREAKLVGDTMNDFYQMTGRGRPIPAGVRAYTNRAYFDQGKAPFEALMSNAGRVMKGLEKEEGAWPEAIRNDFLAKTSHLGLDFDRGFKEDSPSVHLGWASDPEKIARLQELQAHSQDLFAQAGEYVLSARARGMKDPLFRGYRRTHRAGMADNLGTYMEQFNQSTNFYSWDQTKDYDLDQVRTTDEMLTSLERAGEHEIALAIHQNSVSLHGDTTMSRAFLDHVEKGQFDSPLGRALDLHQIGDRNLNAPGGFAGSIFDPDNADVAENFSIDLGRSRPFNIGGKQVEMRYLPVPGIKSYNAAPNGYSVGELSAKEYHHKLLGLVSAAKNDEDDAVLAARGSEYFDSIYENILGKGGILRPEMVYPHAVAGAMQRRGLGEIVDNDIRNPFEMVIGPEQLHKIRDSKLVEQLNAGEHVYATAARHPIARMPIYQVRLAKKDGSDYLGKNMIGYAEGGRSMMQADDDLDLINLIFFSEEKAVERAKRAVTYTKNFEEMSDQWKAYRMVELLQGNLEDSARMTNRSMGEGSRIQEGFNKLYKKTAGGRFQNIGKRLVQAETGMYANLVREMNTSLDSHPILRDQKRRILAELDSFLLKQVTISAAKGKTNLKGDPLSLYHELKAALSSENPEEGANLANVALSKVADAANFETHIRDPRDLEHIDKLFGVTQKTTIADGKMTSVPLQVGDRLNLYRERYLTGNAGSMIEDFIRHRDRSADGTQRLLTAAKTGEGAIDAAEGGRLWRRMKKSTGYSALRGMHLGSTESNFVAQNLGRLNDSLAMGRESITTAAREIAGGFKPSLPVLAAGFGVAALAGLLGTSLHSGNKHRPEERVAVEDRVPGEPVEGAMSARPNVDVRPAPPRTRTTMVAPMRRQSDLEVQATAPDREAAAETARQVQRLTAGNGSNSTTVNYTGGWRNRASKLRMKQELREQLDSQPDF
jgi:hypothetical protein